MNLFQIASRGIDLDALPDESAPERAPLAFEPSPAGSRFAVPQALDAAFEAAGDEYGVDPDVLRAMAFAESRFRPDVISGQVKSRTGATGLMQFMPGTAERFGINPLDPVESIFGAAAYMRSNLEKFDGDYGKAVAAYNLGENRKAYDADDWKDRLPAETRGYLDTVFGVADELKLRAPAQPESKTEAAPKNAPQTAKEPAPIPERTWGEAFGDTTKSLAQGLLDVGSLPGVAYSAVTGDWDTGYLKAIRGTQEVLQDQKSAAIQARNKELQSKLSTAEGWREKLAVGGIETLKDPTLLFDTLARSAPGMFAGGGVGRGVGAAANAAGNAAFAKALGTGSELAARIAVTAKNGAGVLARATATGTAAGIQGASVASDTYDELSKLPVEAFKSEPEWNALEKQHGAQQAKEILAGAAANRALLMATGASVLSMKLVPGGDAIEKMFLPKALKGEAAKAAVASTSLLTRPMGKGMDGGLVSKAVELIVKGSQAGALESVSEGVEEGTGAIAKGLELSRAGQRVNLSEMAGEAYGQGAAAGLVMGKVAGMQGAYGSRTPRVEDMPTTPQAPVIAPTVAPAPSNPAGQDVAAEIMRAESGLAAELAALKARSAPAPDFTQRSTTPQALPGSVPVTGGLAAELQALRARSSSPQEVANVPQGTVPQAKPTPQGASAQAADVARADAPVPAADIPTATDVSTTTQAPGLMTGDSTNAATPANDGTQSTTATGTQGQATGSRVILQNRDRSTPSSIAQMRSIAARPDYGRLGFSRDFANGAPVVAGGTIQPAQMGRKDVATASDGRRIPVQYAVVDAGSVLASNTVDGSSNTDYGNGAVQAVRAIAGNGRIAGLQAAYQSGNANAYRQELVQDAALHGIAPEVIAPMANPVLVRVMPDSEVTADIGDISNTVGNLDLSAVEQANNDANRVQLDALQFADDGSITTDAVRQFVRAMPQSEQGQLLDTNGQPTRQAVDRLSAAVFAKAYGNEALTRLYSQAQDPEARLVMSALAQVAPKMARLEGAGALDVRDVVAQAAEIAVNARRQGVPLAKAAQQMDMAADPDVGVVLDLFASNARTVRPVVEALGRMADMAYTEASKPAEDMFGAVPRASRADIINQLRPENERGSQEALEDAAGREPAAVDAERQAAEPAGSAAPAKAQAGRSAEDAAHEGLNSYTPEEVTRRQAEAAQAAKAEAARQRAADAQAARDENRKRIAQASVRAAAEFELGQDPLDSLTGQGGLMFSRKVGESGQEGVERGIAAAIEKAVQQWQVSLRNAASNPEAKEPGMATPAVLRIMGAAASRLVLPRTYLRAIMDKHGDVPSSVFENLPALLADPLFIIPHKDGGLRVFVESQTAKGEPIAVGVSVGVDGRIHTVTPLHDHDGMTGQGRMARAVVTATSRIYAKNKEALAKAKASAEASPGTIPLQRNSNGNGSVITRADVVKRIAQGTKPGDPRFSFAGARAATADTHALVTAQDRLDAGEDPETVRQETGWHRGADGRMRFEISDADALLKADTSGAEGRRTIGQMFPLGYYGDEVGLTVGRMLHHPALFAAYPAIADIKVKMVYDLRGDDVKGSFNPSTNTITLNQNASWRDAMSTLLHEIQHGIQGIEGFATGDSPERLAGTMPDEKAMNDAKLLARFMAKGESAFDARQRFMRYMGRDPSADGAYMAERYEPDEIARMASTPLDAYKRNAGEVEARNTQARQNMTDAERRATPPGSTADVADADVIVTFNGKEMQNAPAPANAEQGQAAAKQQPSTPVATIRSAITKAYGKLLGQLESKGLVTLTQTEDEAIEAAARARADKTGQPLAEVRATLRASVKNSVADQTQTEAFKRWFKDSKVVDAEGKPLVVYHGTGGDFSSFATGLVNYFSADASAASVYAEGFGKPRKGANVLPVYLSIKNPKWMPLTDSAKLTAGDLAALKADGFDGVFGWVLDTGMGGVTPIAREVGTGQRGMDKIVTEAIPLHPEQIKSVFNRGTFDPADPDIRRSADGSIQGFFDPQTGQSFLIADNLTAEAAPGTLMHEVGIHMAADGKLQPLFDRAANLLKLGRNNPFIQRVQSRMDAAGETSGEEAAAYIAEAYENDRANAPASVSKWVQDFIATVRAWLFNKGVLLKADQLTVADIAAVARANARSLARGNSEGGGFDSHGVGVSTLKRALITRDHAGTDVPGLLYSKSGNATPPIPTSAQDNLFTPSQSWELPEATFTDRLIYELQDGRVDLKRVQEAIAATGKQITEGFDARLAETLLPGRIARRTESFLSVEVKPILEAMAKNNVSQDELSDYLLARHAPERNAQIAKVNPDMPDGGAGTNSQGVLMTTQAARDHIAALTAGKRTVMELLARQVDALTLGTREILVREGLEKQETVDAWAGAYQHYVPLFKDEAMETPGHPIGAGMSVTGTASKRATGSRGEVTNMVAHILMQREAAITRAEKNRVAMALYGLALTNPNAEMWTTIRPSMPSDQIANELVRMGVDPMEAEVGMQGVPTIRSVDSVSGKVVDRPNPMYKRLDNALVVKVNGEDRVILFNANNERAARLVQNLKNQDGVLGQLDIAGSIVGKATRYFAAINTQYNPAFGMVNVIRDVGGALVNLTDTQLAGQQARVLSDSIPAMIGIARDLRGDAQRTPWSDLWQQFQDDGGRTGYRDLFIDPYKRADAVQKELETLGKEGKLTPGAAAHAVLDLLDDFNTTLENGVRLAAYKAALDKGLSRAESARLARELTLDFNRKGRAGRELGPLYAFFNASVQGTARTLKALQGPAGKRILAGGLALGVMQALMLAAAGFDDDEIPEFVKARAFIIPLPGKQYIAIPLQFGLNALPNTGRVVTELLMSGGKDWGEKSFNALGELLGSFNPLGGGNIFTGAGALKTIAPTVIDPIVDMATNTDFTGKPIGKERMPWDTRPGFTMGRESTQRSFTGQAYIGISKAINSVTGGNDFAQGLASPSPEEVRYVFTTVGGGVFREMEKILNASVLTAQGESLKAREVPLGSRFAGEVDDQDLQRSRYFKNTARLEKLEAQLKGFSKEGRADEVRKLIDDNPLVRLYELNDEVRSNVTKLNKLAGESINDKEVLKRIDAARTTYMRALNDKVREMEKAGDKAASVPVRRSPDVDDDATGEPSLEAESN